MTSLEDLKPGAIVMHDGYPCLVETTSVAVVMQRIEPRLAGLDIFSASGFPQLEPASPVYMKVVGSLDSEAIQSIVPLVQKEA